MLKLTRLDAETATLANSEKDVRQTVLNMGDVYRDAWEVSSTRNLCAEAQAWLVRRLPAEVARGQFCESRPGVFLGQWDWLAQMSAGDREEMQKIRQMTETHVARALANNEPTAVYIGTSHPRHGRRLLTEYFEIADWLAALPTGAPSMLRKLPRVTWQQAIGHSRRWHERLAKKGTEAVTAAEFADGAEVVLELEYGWRWVRLTTGQALDREGQAMGHCVGSGGYDDLVDADAPDGLYSLRDDRGRPHVTVEVRNGIIEQAQGKSNTTPTGHSARLAELVQALDVDIEAMSPGRLGMARVDGQLMPIAQALEVLSSGHVDGDIDLSGADIENLPEGLSVGGKLDLNSCTALISLPDGLAVGGDMDIYGCTLLESLPTGLRVGGWLDVSECASLTSLPQDLLVGGEIYGADHLPRVGRSMAVAC